MGCDIHLLIQVRRDGAWEDYDTGLDEHLYWQLWEPRSYDTFALLADVRNDGSVTPISRPRGIPDDFECEDYRTSIHSRLGLVGDVERNGKDLGDHSHSWVTLAELCAVPEADRTRWVPGYWLAELCSIGAPEDVRLVFGFDS